MYSKYVVLMLWGTLVKTYKLSTLWFIGWFLTGLCLYLSPIHHVKKSFFFTDEEDDYDDDDDTDDRNYVDKNYIDKNYIDNQMNQNLTSPNRDFRAQLSSGGYPADIQYPIKSGSEKRAVSR